MSVIDPSSNTLLGQIRLGNVRPDVLSPLYKGELNVHGLDFSPDHKTLIAISNGSNSVTFIDTGTNQVKGIAYIGRSPHEAFFTPDGKQVWAVVRGENYVSVIDAATFKEVGRIETAAGPGMVLFHPQKNIAFVVHSFTPEVDVIDVPTRKVIKRIPVVSPFSPFLQFTPDFKEVWMTHKDVGKVTRIDTDTLEVKGVIETGFITNHLAFAKTARGTLAFITLGGENAVKVYTTDATPKLLTTIPVGALPHGIWSSDDGTRTRGAGPAGAGLRVERRAQRHGHGPSRAACQRRAGQHCAQCCAGRGPWLRRGAQPRVGGCPGSLPFQAQAANGVQRVHERPAFAHRQFQDQPRWRGQRHGDWPAARSGDYCLVKGGLRRADSCGGRQCIGGSINSSFNWSVTIAWGDWDLSLSTQPPLHLHESILGTRRWALTCLRK